MKFRPLHDESCSRALMLRRSTGGIIIPDTAKEKPQEGELSLSDQVGVTRVANSFQST